MVAASTLLQISTGIFSLSAVQVMFAPDLYFTGEVDHSDAQWQKYQMIAFLMMWNVNFAMNAYAQSLNPTKETCLINIAMWLLWVIFHVFGCIFNPMYDIAGIDKSAIFIWPIMGGGFIYGFSTAMKDAPESNAGSTLSFAHAVALCLCIMNIAVFAGQADGADAMYYPNMSKPNAVANVFNSFNKVHCGLSSFMNLLSTYSMRNSNRAQDLVMGSTWAAWGFFFVWMILKNDTMLNALGADKVQFVSWIVVSLGIAGLFFTNKDSGKTQKTN